jgi:hypothetical protein
MSFPRVRFHTLFGTDDQLFDAGVVDAVLDCAEVAEEVLAVTEAVHLRLGVGLLAEAADLAERSTLLNDGVEGSLGLKNGVPSLQKRPFHRVTDFLIYLLLISVLVSQQLLFFWHILNNYS